MGRRKRTRLAIPELARRMTAWIERNPIKLYCAVSGVTGEAIAKHLGACPASVHHWMIGRSIPKEQYLLGLAMMIGPRFTADWPAWIDNRPTRGD